jgi:hypothetical protein
MKRIFLLQLSSRPYHARWMACPQKSDATGKGAVRETVAGSVAPGRARQGARAVQTPLLYFNIDRRLIGSGLVLWLQRNSTRAVCWTSEESDAAPKTVDTKGVAAIGADEERNEKGDGKAGGYLRLWQ